jgi:hypothetical protein
MSDIEHERFVENRSLRSGSLRLATVAQRALITAIDAQDASFGAHYSASSTPDHPTETTPVETSNPSDA